MTFAELDQRLSMPVQIVDYGNKVAIRYKFNEPTVDEKYRRPVLSRRRRKKKTAEKARR